MLEDTERLGVQSWREAPDQVGPQPQRTNGGASGTGAGVPKPEIPK